MTQTYSQSITGIDAGARYNAPATIRVGDVDLSSNVNQKWAPDVAGNVTSRNNYILCKNPDGSQSYYRIDAERSIPGVSLVMIAV